MRLTETHIQAIKTAASTVEYGSITIKSGTDSHLDIIVENRIRLPKETAQNERKYIKTYVDMSKPQKTQ